MTTIRNGDPLPQALVQGDTWTLPFTWNGTDGLPIDITNITIASALKKEYSQSVLVSWTVTKTDAANGQFTLTLTPTQTESLPANKGKRITTFVMDVQATYPGGTVSTIFSTRLNMQHQVTP